MGGDVMADDNRVDGRVEKLERCYEQVARDIHDIQLDIAARNEWAKHVLENIEELSQKVGTLARGVGQVEADVSKMRIEFYGYGIRELREEAKAANDGLRADLKALTDSVSGHQEVLTGQVTELAGKIKAVRQYNDQRWDFFSKGLYATWTVCAGVIVAWAVKTFGLK